MKKLRLHLLIILGVYLICFIIGSFVDLKLMEALFSKNNGFGLTFAAIGTIPGYSVFAIIGGGFLWLGLQKSFKTSIRFIFFILMVVGLGCGIYFSGKEWFGENGFYNPKIYWVGFLITTPIMGGMFYLGYYLTSKANNPRIWILFVALTIAAFIALVGGVTLLKAIFHRPRYRELVSGGVVPFHNWWDRCSNYKDFVALGYSKEEFKSFPSGHSGGSLTSLYFLAFIPVFFKKSEKWHLLAIYSGVAWSLLVCFTRILVGAHFLSDVAMGGILSIGCLIIANEVVIRTKCIQQE